MADFEQVFDDFGDTVSDGVENVKDFIKEKPFVVAVVVVAAAGLFVAWKKSREATETTEEAATFYTYPVTGSAAGFQGESMEDSMYSDLLGNLSQIEKDYAESVNELDQQYGSQFAEMESVLNDLQSQNMTLADQVAENKAAVQRNQVINQMEANSDLWHLTSDAEERKRLEQENQKLGASIGMSFNSKQGTWYNADGDIAYLTPLQTAKGRTPSNTKSSGTMTNNKTYQASYNDAVAKSVTYDKNVDYRAKINEAKASGASQSVIDSLTAQRNAKIAGEYGGVDPDTVKKK